MQPILSFQRLQVSKGTTAPKDLLELTQNIAHRANCSNEDNIPPLTKAKEEIGDITLLTEFCFNEDILYQDYNHKFPVEGGNEKPGKWYGRALNHGDGMCSWILTADDELVVRTIIRFARNDRPYATLVDELYKCVCGQSKYKKIY